MSLLELLLPRACAACKAAGRSPLCERCERDVEWIRPPLCDGCGAPATAAVARCAECAGRDLSFRRARAAALYRGPARDALIAFKLLGDRRSAGALARPMAAAARALATPAPVAVTFVPSARRAQAQRGFNPAAALAAPLARRLGLSASALLRKARETPDAAGLGRDARRRALAGAFVAVRRPPERVLLVDDILTTGATADACARALLAAGATAVDVVVFARAAGGDRIRPPR